jgi:hypothetical protein
VRAGVAAGEEETMVDPVSAYADELAREAQVPEPWDIERGTFVFQGQRYPYADHRPFPEEMGARRIELALALPLVLRYRGRVFYVRNLHSDGDWAYVRKWRDIDCDPSQCTTGAWEGDVEKIPPGFSYERIISLSTVAQIGLDQRDRLPARSGGDHPDPEKALRVLRRLGGDLLAPSGYLLVTVPMGYHPHLDAAILEGRTGLRGGFLRRLNPESEWREIDASEVGRPEYGTPFPGANVLAVLTHQPGDPRQGSGEESGTRVTP